LGLYHDVHIVLHAQKHLEGFYQSLGYQSKGKPFMEANIEHIAMEKKIKRSTF
jgi:predicted GNAT family N-acyltransferase